MIIRIPGHQFLWPTILMVGLNAVINLLDQFIGLDNAFRQKSAFHDELFTNG
jgi:hypothetical protein